MNELLKKYLPHILAIILFAGLSATFFYPVITEDKTLFQSDLENMVGWGKDLKDYHEQTGDYAFWSNSMFSGMPANYTFMPSTFNIFEHLRHLFNFYLPLSHIGMLFIYLLGFYIFLISIGCKPLLSIVGALAYAFTTYNLVSLEVGHLNKCLVMATMAPLIGGIILTYRKKFLWGTIITLYFTGINIYYNHPQISYYLLLMIIILAIVYLVYAIKEKTIPDYFKSSAILLVIALIAAAPSLGKLISNADYAKDTMRGGSVLQKNDGGNKESSGLDIDYAFQWSYGKMETMTLLIPNFYGAKTSYNIGADSESYKFLQKAGYGNQAVQFSKYAPMYWGDQPMTSGPSYAGAIVCFLFVLGLFVVKGPEKWWLLAATILSFVLAWGRNLELINNLLFYYLPLYSKFRTPAMALTIAEVTMVAMAILALKEIGENWGNGESRGNGGKYMKSLYISAGITGGLCLIYALIGGSMMSFSSLSDANYPPELLDAIIKDRKNMLTSDAWRSLFFIALSTGILWYYLKKSIKITYLIATIGVLIFIDLWMVDRRFLNEDSFVAKQKSSVVKPTEADLQILQDKDPNYRVFNYAPNWTQESNTSYFHKSIGGYSPVKLQRYQDIIDHHLLSGSSLNVNVLNMLNTRYIIFQSQQGQPPQVSFNAEALGNAWFVNEIKWVNSPDEEIAALKDFDPSQVAVIDTEWKTIIPNWQKLQHENDDSTANIRLKDYVNPGNIIYESSSIQPHLAVFSEVHYKTWRAYIDGNEVPVIRVNYILRGLEIPAGSHTIEFKCIDNIYLRGAKMSLIASIITGIILLSLLGYAGWRAFKK